MDKNHDDVNLKLSEKFNKTYVSNIRLKRLLKIGADPNIIFNDEDGKTIFMEAAHRGHLKAVKLMMNYGAELDIVDKEFGMNAFLYACASGHIKTVKFLLGSGADLQTLADDKSNGLMHAAFNHYFEMVKFLSEKGIDINAKNDKGQTAFMYAADKCQGEMFSTGTNIQEMKKLKIKVFQELINIGADMNMIDNKGNSVLAYVVGLGCVQLTRFLLENGADANVTEQNMYLLAENAEENSEILIELLKEHGADTKPFFVQYKTSVYCSECKNVIPLNGPLSKIKCPDCLTYTPLDNTFWKNIIKYSSHTEYKYTLEDTCTVEILGTAPVCSECGEKLNIDIKKTDLENPLICAKCNTRNQHFPAPAWLAECKIVEYNPKYIYCAEAEGETAEELNNQLEPIAFRCVSCAANLSLDAKAPRNFTCDHCGTKQYLPDPLWIALHPVIKRKHWYVLFESKNNN